MSNVTIYDVAREANVMYGNRFPGRQRESECQADDEEEGA